MIFYKLKRNFMDLKTEGFTYSGLDRDRFRDQSLWAISIPKSEAPEKAPHPTVEPLKTLKFT